MRWLFGLIIALQAPFLFIALLAGGTDGKTSSALKVAGIILPIAFSSAYVMYRFVTAERLKVMDWIAVAAACIPTLYVLYFAAKSS